MSISKEKLEELKQIMKEDYNKDMSDDDIEVFGKNLIETFGILFDVDRAQKFEDPRRSIDQLGTASYD